MNPEQVRISKEKIINFVKNKGPSLPVHLAKEINSNLLFTGAILSELLSDKILKLSHLKIGTSHLYMMPGQDLMLENFFHYLNTREKEAFSLLKEKSILEDDLQTPVIRVALRSIKDFALPFKSDNKLFWRFFSVSEDKVRQLFQEKPKQEIIKEIPIIKPLPPTIETPIINQTIKEEKPLGIFEETKEETPIVEEKPKEKKPKVSFIEEVKAVLANKGINIVSIEKADKKEAIIKLADSLIIAFNKKKISDKDLIKAYKKSLAYNLPYTILAKEEMPKKLKETIEAHKNLKAIEKL